MRTSRTMKMWMSAAVAIGSAAALAGCAARSTSHTDVDNQEYSTEVTLHGNRAEALLQTGRNLVSEGRFDTGIGYFERAYSEKDAKPEHKAQALFDLGAAHGSILNSRRDPQKAIGYYQQLLDQFPDSKLCDGARKAIEAQRVSMPK